MMRLSNFIPLVDPVPYINKEPSSSVSFANTNYLVYGIGNSIRYSDNYPLITVYNFFSDSI
nr:MAG TPA: hypothetical protein [Bacteriophage sp.]